ncbi:hypothetical protein EYC84_010927 [Monilinia fructicola]|uniref:Uncharacterized protein n=1 Tax=Monilinia fructicola TaxID=38448 RepID=A0A5M9J9G0_MONFR|nr:hypothetical protein EYC84_010927 [Monilinia fructicola]
MWQKQQKSIACRGSCGDIEGHAQADCIHILCVVWKWHIWFFMDFSFCFFLLVYMKGIFALFLSTSLSPRVNLRMTQAEEGILVRRGDDLPDLASWLLST